MFKGKLFYHGSDNKFEKFDVKKGVGATYLAFDKLVAARFAVYYAKDNADYYNLNDAVGYLYTVRIKDDANIVNFNEYNHPAVKQYAKDLDETQWKKVNDVRISAAGEELLDDDPGDPFDFIDYNSEDNEKTLNEYKVDGFIFNDGLDEINLPFSVKALACLNADIMEIVKVEEIPVSLYNKIMFTGPTIYKPDVIPNDGNSNLLEEDIYNLKKQAWPLSSKEIDDKSDINSQEPYDSLVVEKSLVDGQPSSISYDNGIISPVEDVSYVKDIKDVKDSNKKAKAYIEILSKKDNNALALFSCNLAKTFQDKVAGLQIYDSLEENSGLFFEYKKPEDVIYHMGTVKFPIDIIFIDKDNKIKKICKNIQPGTLGTFGCAQTKYVLEICGGLSDRLEINQDDIIKVDFKEGMYLEKFNKISKYLGIDKNIIVKYNDLNFDKLQNWNGHPILNVSNNINKIASNNKPYSSLVKSFKPKAINLSLFDFDNLIEKDPNILIYSSTKAANEDELINLTINGLIVKANLNNFRIVKAYDVGNISNNESILLARSFSEFMKSSFEDFMDLLYKMKDKSKTNKIVVATRYDNKDDIKNMLFHKIKLHLGEEIDFEIMKVSKDADYYNLIIEAKDKYKTKKIELYSDFSLLKRAGVPVSDDVKQKARKVYKLLDSASDVIETSLENMRQNVAEYEKIKDDADAIKRTKGLYNQSVKRNTRIIREFLIKIRDAIKLLNEIKDVSTTIEVINGITSTTKIVSEAIENIFDLIEELDNPDFYMTLSEKVKEYEKNIEDLQYSISRGINYINTDILGLIILSE